MRIAEIEPGEGFGLGLSIARQAVEAVGGTPELERAAGPRTAARIRPRLRPWLWLAPALAFAQAAPRIDEPMTGSAMRSFSVKSLMVFTSARVVFRYSGIELSEPIPFTSRLPWVRAQIVIRGPMPP